MGKNVNHHCSGARLRSYPSNWEQYIKFIQGKTHYSPGNEDNCDISGNTPKEVPSEQIQP